MSRTMRPPLPIRIAFWESVSTQTWALDLDQAVLALGDLLDRDLDRVRDLLAGAAQDLLADQLGEVDLARLVGAVLGRIEERPSGISSARRSVSGARPVPRFAEIGKISSTTSSSAASASTSSSAAWSEAVDLVDRADRPGPRGRAASRCAAMKRSPGPDPLLAVDDEEHGVGALELVLDPALHPLGEHVARALDPGQVDEHQLPARGDVGRDTAAGAAGRLRAVGDDRDLGADDRVDERRLADVRAPGEADEAGPCRHRHLSVHSPACILRHHAREGRSTQGGDMRKRIAVTVVALAAVAAPASASANAPPTTGRFYGCRAADLDARRAPGVLATTATRTATATGRDRSPPTGPWTCAERPLTYVPSRLPGLDSFIGSRHGRQRREGYAYIYVTSRQAADDSTAISGPRFVNRRGARQRPLADRALQGSADHGSLVLPATGT